MSLSLSCWRSHRPRSLRSTAEWLAKSMLQVKQSLAVAGSRYSSTGLYSDFTQRHRNVKRPSFRENNQTTPQTGNSHECRLITNAISTDIPGLRLRWITQIIGRRNSRHVLMVNHYSRCNQNDRPWPNWKADSVYPGLSQHRFQIDHIAWGS